MEGSFNIESNNQKSNEEVEYNTFAQEMLDRAKNVFEIYQALLEKYGEKHSSVENARMDSRITTLGCQRRLEFKQRDLKVKNIDVEIPSFEEYLAPKND